MEYLPLQATTITSSSMHQVLQLGKIKRERERDIVKDKSRGVHVPHGCYIVLACIITTNQMYQLSEGQNVCLVGEDKMLPFASLK